MQPKRGGGHTIAGAALRNAGLVDGDVGMRDASGPSRRGAGAGRSRKGGRNGADSNGSLSVSINGSSIPSLKPLQRHPPRLSTITVGFFIRKASLSASASLDRTTPEAQLFHQYDQS